MEMLRECVDRSFLLLFCILEKRMASVSMFGAYWISLEGGMRIYISGPITGHDDYREKFKEVQERLEAAGHEVINPAEISATLPKLEYEKYMEIDFVLLKMCDAIFMMEGWQESCGANREYGYALAAGMKVLEGE